ncbi:hypothetical protein [Corallococcus exercitus]
MTVLSILPRQRAAVLEAARALALGLQHVECTLLRFGLPPGALIRP